MIDNLTPGLWCLNRRADQGDPYAVAMRAEFARLYDAAGERRPDALGMPREDGLTEYHIDAGAQVTMHAA